MGIGAAREAARRFPRLPYELGRAIKTNYNQVHGFGRYRLFSLPVKHHWSDPADRALIVQSAKGLFWKATSGSFKANNKWIIEQPIYLECSEWEWNFVTPLIAPILDDRFTVVQFAATRATVRP